ncbi:MULTISPECIES: SecY-interacting protein [unclassified Gilliamella]|uniref:SecY-interacting protein n=1 Tax=unclassified Gilliamella TaxID=2685620 RepID=UPI00130A80C5|nr:MULTISPECIES: SecY-interacting protein [unclassified Gilliamella]MWP49680.1 SecY-interacting protein [Gilliamella sp. Lep-s35]MWP69484.1 SecY-interacting protein [Gilliamella sp. Lep-s5]MWP77748.1 SecY-interacting protein [Gilliamella sp. Lep-s21]
MDIRDKTALIDFTSRWVDQFDDAPQSEELHAIPSSCILKTEQLTVYWQPFLLTPPRSLTIVEQLVGITLHPSSHVFYGTQYAGNMTAKFNNINLVLIQPWNDDDFSNLEQNLIAHLSQQKKLRRTPTVFIASTDESTEIISLNNLTGEVVKEDLITGELTVLADDLPQFLQQLVANY